MILNIYTQHVAVIHYNYFMALKRFPLHCHFERETTEQWIPVDKW